MSIQQEITRLTTDRATMRTKLVDLGLATSTATYDDIATAISGIVNRGSVTATVMEGTTYTIPAGYHNGSGTVTGIGGGGHYELQDKTITPTKQQQPVTADSGYYGLSSVTVNAIPDNFQDVSSVTATAADVLTTKVFVKADGTVTAGTMPNNGTITTQTLTASSTSYTIPAGYHSGSGKVQIVTEDKGTITPGKTNQTITPSSGKVISKVVVAGDSDLDAANIKSGVNIFNVGGTFTSSSTVSSGQSAANASNIMSGKSAWVDGAEVKGTMSEFSLDSTHDSLAPSVYNNKLILTLTTGETQPVRYITGDNEYSLTTDITSRVASDVTASGGSMNIPAGYYASAVTKSLTTGALATPTVSSSGLVTASVSSAGYLDTSASKTLQLSTQAAATITPGTTNQTAVATGKYTTGTVTVAGDADLVAANIKKGVNIFGVDGTFTNTSSGINAYEVITGKEGWANGNKITGTMPEFVFGDHHDDDAFSDVDTHDDQVYIILRTGSWPEYYKYLSGQEDYTIPLGIYAFDSQSYAALGDSPIVYDGTYWTDAMGGKFAVVSFKNKYSAYIKGYYNQDPDDVDYCGGSLKTAIPWIEATDVTVSGATVTVPRGYYNTGVTKSVTTATHSNPTATINTSTGVVTASHTQSTGYVTGGTTTGTLSLSTQAAKTVTPSTSSQTAVAAGKYTTGAVTVAAIPSKFVDSSTVTSTAANVLEDTYAVVKTGTNTWAVAEGTMTNRGTVTASFTGLGAVTGDTSYTIAAGYYAGGTVSLTDDIETALAAL